MTFIPSLAFESEEEIKKQQEILLKQQVKYASETSRFYKRQFTNLTDSSDITFEKFATLPFTTKEHLQKYNEDFYSVPHDKIRDYTTTSGTLGEPVIVPLSASDIERLGYNESQSFQTAGCSEKDTFQLSTTIDKMFMAGLAYWLGAGKLSAGIVRVGPGAPALQWNMMHKVRPSVLIAVPSFLIKLLDFADLNNIDYSSASVKKVVCIGEPVREPDNSLNTLGKRITERWNIDLIGTYASTEMQSAITECPHHYGSHIPPDLLYAEIIDDKGNPVSEGEAGEIVITPLGVQGMPLIRFRTGDLAEWHSGKCRCGRSSMRISPIIGRKAQMIKFKGTTLFPASFFNVLDKVSWIDQYQVVVSLNENGLDHVTIRFSTTEEVPGAIQDLRGIFKSSLRVIPHLQPCPSQEIKRSVFPEDKRKPIKYLDKRFF